MFKLISTFGLVLISLTLTSGQSTNHLPPCTRELQNQHFPSGFDCQSYFTCFNEVYILQSCPANFWFQRTLGSCAIIQDVLDCEFAPVPTVPPVTTTVPTVPPVTTPAPTTTAPTTIAPTTTAPTTIAPTSTTLNPGLGDVCPPTGVTNLINPYSCTRYVMCFDGVKTERSCSPGLYFSRSLLRCVRRAESDCNLDNSSCPADNDPENIIFLPDQEDCQLFFVCIDGEPVEFDCGESLHFEPNFNWCIKEEDSVCEPSYPLPDVREIECPEDTENDIIFLPHPEECQFYFICLDGVSILARCARNLLFDYQIEKCFFADAARCFNRNVLQLN